jgi:hypothetical protein
MAKNIEMNMEKYGQNIEKSMDRNLIDFQIGFKTFIIETWTSALKI